MSSSYPIVKGPRISIPYNMGGGELYDQEHPITPVIDKLYHTEYLFGEPLAYPADETIYFNNCINGSNLLYHMDNLLSETINKFTNSDRGDNIQSYVDLLSINSSIVRLTNKSDDNNIQSYADILTDILTQYNYFTHSTSDDNLQSSMDEHINPFHMGEAVTFKNT